VEIFATNVMLLGGARDGAGRAGAAGEGKATDLPEAESAGPDNFQDDIPF